MVLTIKEIITRSWYSGLGALPTETKSLVQTIAEVYYLKGLYKYNRVDFISRGVKTSEKRVLTLKEEVATAMHGVSWGISK